MQTIAETGRVALSGNDANISNAALSTSVTFSKIYDNPVVVAYIPTNGGGQDIDARVANLTGSGCDLFLIEPDHAGHNNEDVTYFVAEEGVHETEDGIMVEAGRHQTEYSVEDGESFTGDRVSFNRDWPSTPVTFATPNTHNNGEWATSGIANLDASGFNTGQQRGGSSSTVNAVDYEEIGYIAFENAGVGTIDGAPFETGTTTGYTTSFTAGFSVKPDVFVEAQTRDGTESGWARGNGGSWTTTDYDWQYESSSTGQTFGYVAIEPGTVVSGFDAASDKQGTLTYISPSEWPDTTSDGYSSSSDRSGGTYSGTVESQSSAKDTTTAETAVLSPKPVDPATATTATVAKAETAVVGLTGKGATMAHADVNTTGVASTTFGTATTEATATVTLDGMLTHTLTGSGTTSVTASANKTTAETSPNEAAGTATIISESGKATAAANPAQAGGNASTGAVGSPESAEMTPIGASGAAHSAASGSRAVFSTVSRVAFGGSTAISAANRAEMAGIPRGAGASTETVISANITSATGIPAVGTATTQVSAPANRVSAAFTPGVGDGTAASTGLGSTTDATLVPLTPSISLVVTASLAGVQTTAFGASTSTATTSISANETVLANPQMASGATDVAGSGQQATAGADTASASGSRATATAVASKASASTSTASASGSASASSASGTAAAEAGPLSASGASHAQSVSDTTTALYGPTAATGTASASGGTVTEATTSEKGATGTASASAGSVPATATVAPGEGSVATETVAQGGTTTIGAASEGARFSSLTAHPTIGADDTILANPKQASATTYTDGGAEKTRPDTLGKSNLDPKTATGATGSTATFGVDTLLADATSIAVGGTVQTVTVETRVGSGPTLHTPGVFVDSSTGASGRDDRSADSDDDRDVIDPEVWMSVRADDDRSVDRS